ncbi:hypothetical protein BLOT_012635 [Blomia tropicalis]|nr:hypothetical protein BLOT_012635 [Blomia tropicalis]
MKLEIENNGRFWLTELCRFNGRRILPFILWMRRRLKKKGKMVNVHGINRYTPDQCNYVVLLLYYSYVELTSPHIAAILPLLLDCNQKPDNGVIRTLNCSAPGVVADNGGPGGGGGGGGGPCCTVGVGPAFVGLVPVPG